MYSCITAAHILGCTLTCACFGGFPSVRTHTGLLRVSPVCARIRGGVIIVQYKKGQRIAELKSWSERLREREAMREYKRD